MSRFVLSGTLLLDHFFEKSIALAIVAGLTIVVGDLLLGLGAHGPHISAHLEEEEAG